MVNIDEFHKNCGELLRLGIATEFHLEFFISNYFVRPQDERYFLFNDLIAIKLNFERKIEIFKEICKLEQVEPELLGKIIANIKEIQKVRNKIAHDEGFIRDQNEGILLQKKTSIKFKKDELKIDENLVKKIRERHDFVAKNITALYLELNKPDRKKPIRII